MEKAIHSAKSGIRRSAGGPFGACITKGSKLLAVCHNTVFKHRDPTRHAEINTIRIASKKLKAWSLKGCTIYTTTEPCPMCFAAIHWARIDRAIYGTSIREAQKRGFYELTVGSRTLKRLGRSRVKITAGYMKEECRALLQYWESLPGQKIY